MIRKLHKLYNNDFYTLFIVLIAVVSLFAPISNRLDLLINGLFVVDLIISTLIFTKSSSQKNIPNYLKHHAADILSCIPIQFLSIFKTFRLLRLVRVSRLFKLTRTMKVSNDISFSNLFKIETFKELLVYFSIYLLANVYIFREIEHVSDLDAIYWVIVTITTVGYGDISPSHPLTKIMAIFLIMLGVATTSYINGAIISTIIKQHLK
ncbi:potassium channel family protein [Lactococcus garvieae]|uniref:potassium channel family protein n=1 Tax=Lactococcus garvieae TaxID=1363 RepID=UPI0018D830CF|nr:ion channel [Lactococcus garvieae]QPS71518.1 ion transporter [Lactococcus garvieae]